VDTSLKPGVAGLERIGTVSRKRKRPRVRDGIKRETEGREKGITGQSCVYSTGRISLPGSERMEKSTAEISCSTLRVKKL